jgi:hypothetical protein
MALGGQNLGLDIRLTLKISGGQKLRLLIRNTWTRPLNLDVMRQSKARASDQESFDLKAERIRSAS